MGPDTIAMLFCPPKPPVRLERQRVLALGRGQECDLPVPCPLASRRHAEVWYDGAGWVLRDLHSKNGTRVNGVPIEGDRRLQAGDRIEIGTSVVTYCEVHPQFAELVPTATQTMTLLVDAEDAPPAPTDLRESFAGNLGEIPFFAVLQILELGAQTGALRISSPRIHGVIWFEDGTPVHGEAGDLSGFEAAVALVRLTSGRFAFEGGGAAPRRTISEGVTLLLLEAFRLCDEQSSPPEESTAIRNPLRPFGPVPAAGTARPIRPGLLRSS